MSYDGYWILDIEIEREHWADTKDLPFKKWQAERGRETAAIVDTRALFVDPICCSQWPLLADPSRSWPVLIASWTFNSRQPVPNPIAVSVFFSLPFIFSLLARS